MATECKKRRLLSAISGHVSSTDNDNRLVPSSSEETVNVPLIVKLNVGGALFTTKRSTITKYPDSMLAVLFSGRYNVDKDQRGYFFIERNGEMFEHILEFLKDDTYLPPEDKRLAVYKEADYFTLTVLTDRLVKIPPMFPFHGLRPDPIEDYTTLKESLLDASSDFVMASAHKKTEIYIIFFNSIHSLEDVIECCDEICLGEQDHVKKEVYGFHEYIFHGIHDIGPDNDTENEKMYTLSTEKAKSREQALSVINCLEHDFKEEGYNVSYELESCHFESLLNRNTGNDTIIPYVAYKDAKYGDMFCQMCYCHCRFVFHWA